MKIAVLSDIHGNPIALDAVLADIAAQGGVDEHWFIGDLTAIGFDPVSVLERIAALPSVVCTKGNSEAYLLDGVEFGRPDPKPTNESEWLHQIGISRTFGFTFGQVCQAGWLTFLQELPFEHRVTLPDGTRALAIHASPGKIDGRGIRPDRSEHELLERMATADADLVLVGHTHWPMNRMIGKTHVVNMGSVSNQTQVDLRAKYILLEANEGGYTIEHRYIDYDRTACVLPCEQLAHPGLDFVAGIARGEFVAKWQRRYSSAELLALLPPTNIKLPRP